MLDDKVSFIKACQDYFSTGEHGKKIDIPEFKKLSREDKVELHKLLTEEGYKMDPLVEITSE